MAPNARLSEATFAFIDVETTGLSHANDAVIEIACVVVRGGREVESFSTLINPGRPIPPEASAVHNINDADVAGAPSFAEVAPRLRELCADAVIVAHNARFDMGFLPLLADRPVICSMRFAQLVLPEAPNYKNQGLRTYLGVSDPRLENAGAHRALADVIVTTHIFRHCQERYLTLGHTDDVTALIAKLNEPRALRSFPFGRHKGAPLESVPVDYLQWLITKATAVSDDAKHTARTELERRGVIAPSLFQSLQPIN
jgi:exodeoxyribonuclease X